VSSGLAVSCKLLESSQKKLLICGSVQRVFGVKAAVASDSSHGFTCFGFVLLELKALSFLTEGDGGDCTQNYRGSGHLALPLFGFSFWSSLRFGLRFEL
jgi:hypothetical protein